VDFLDLIEAAAGIGVLIYLGYYLYTLGIWSDTAIKWKGIHATGVVVDSEAAGSQTPDLSTPRDAHFITYEFTDPSGKKWINTRKLGSRHKLAGVVMGSEVSVYYLPDRPYKSTLG